MLERLCNIIQPECQGCRVYATSGAAQSKVLWIEACVHSLLKTLARPTYMQKAYFQTVLGTQ